MGNEEQLIGISESQPSKAIDPVCGMTVNPQTARGSVEYQGKKYYFCNPRCAERFQAEPEKYLSPETEVREPEVAPAEATEYTCPMHPEIVRDRPGSCPICGMALEPRTITAAHEDDDSELRSMQLRFWVGVALCLPLLVLSMSTMAEGSPLRHLSPGLSQWLQLALATPVVLWGGWPFFERGWASLVNRSLNMFTLIAMGTGTAYLYSVIATVAPGIFPESFFGHGGRPEVYFEVSAMIVTLVLLGQVLELRARKQTGSAIKALLDLSPKTAFRLSPGSADEEISLEHVHRGDR